MPQNNLKQADVLEGATLLPNANGSAPGQWLDTTFAGYRKLIALLPGPPHECRPLFDAECLPRLLEAVPPRSIAVRTLKAAMIPESQADKLLAPIYTTYTDVETTLLAHTGDLQITLICSKPTLTPPGNASTSSPSASKRRSKTGSTPRRATRSSRSCSTISDCARPRSPSPKAAPAA